MLVLGVDVLMDIPVDIVNLETLHQLYNETKEIEEEFKDISPEVVNAYVELGKSFRNCALVLLQETLKRVEKQKAGEADKPV